MSNGPSSKLFASLFALAFPLSGCIGTADGVETTGEMHSDHELSEWIEIGTELHPLYIQDGDQVILGEKNARVLEGTAGALIVQRDRDGDSKWDAAQKGNLTYCVSDAFGGRKDLILDALAHATREWEQAADIDFVHVESEDARCNARNRNVLFDIRPTSGRSYRMRAFFPGMPRAARNVLVNDRAYEASLRRVMTHELGHVLGFRHEHERPEDACGNTRDWRALTDYDADSIMHYGRPRCGGTNTSDHISSLDAEGAAALYGSPHEDGPAAPSGIQQDVEVEGHVATAESIRYRAIASVPGSVIEVDMRGDGDADLHVAVDRQVTTSDFDCRPYFDGSVESCRLDAGESFTILVNGFQAADYQLRVRWLAPAP